MNIGLVIPTLNAGESFAKLLKNIELQNIKISEKIIIDSGSVDDTLLLGEKYNYKIIKIEKFNHGNSRKIAVENLHKSDVVVFITATVVVAAAVVESNERNLPLTYCLYQLKFHKIKKKFSIMLSFLLFFSRMIMY